MTEKYSSEHGVSLVMWHDNSDVLVASTASGMEPIASTTRFCRREKKKVTVQRPASVGLYNSTMGGVDLLDANVSNCRVAIRGKKWYYPIFLYLVDVACVNSWLNYRLCIDSTKSYNEFRTSVASSMLARNTRMRNTKQASNDFRFDNFGHMIEFTEKELRCKLCFKNTKFWCKKCSVNLHPKCFSAFHTK